MASDPLSTDVRMDNGRMVLVLSNKKDAYYMVTEKACSCPSAAYRPGQRCKHQRLLVPGEQPMTKLTTDSVKPTVRWGDGYNGPFVPEEIPPRQPLLLVMWTRCRLDQVCHTDLD